MRFLGLLLILALPAPALAQSYGKALAEPARPPHLPDVPIDQGHLGRLVPTDLVFRDEHDQPIKLADAIGGKPTILVLAYYHCPTLCNQVLNGLVESLKKVPQDVGDKFNVVVVSFDPKDHAAIAFQKRENYVRDYGRPGGVNGWHFLTGEKPAIDALCEAVGFTYDFDEKRKIYNHSSGLMVLSPRGRVTRYFFTIDNDPDALWDALADAAADKVGEPSTVKQLLCSYDPVSGRYTLSALKCLRAAAALTVLGLGLWLVRVWVRQRRPGRAAPPPAADAAAAPPERL
jgi:protein SCO1/2